MKSFGRTKEQHRTGKSNGKRAEINIFKEDTPKGNKGCASYSTSVPQLQSQLWGTKAGDPGDTNYLHKGQKRPSAFLLSLSWKKN